MSRAAAPDVELKITGMTCASCAARVERRLDAIEGVDASVNLATETATVHAEPGAHVDLAALIDAVKQAGYEAHLVDDGVSHGHGSGAGHDHDHDEPRANLVLAAVLGIPVIALSMVPGLQVTHWQWIALALSTPVVWWAGRSFHARAWASARHGGANMDTLISIGTAAAWGYSLVALAVLGAGDASEAMTMSLTGPRGAHAVYFEVACGVVLLVLFGRFLEARARRRAGDAVRALLTMQVRDAHVLRDGALQAVPIAEVRVGDTVRVRAGEQVPVDARVIEGSSSLDTSMVTGEPVPRSAAAGDEIIGGTMNLTGVLTATVLRVGTETMLAQIARRVRDAQAGKARIQRLADRVSGVFVPAVVVLAAATLVAWLLAGDSFARAFGIAVTVLIVACPCALGLATPVALLAGTGRGARAGVLIGGAEVLESTRRIDTVVFDKTGTLTEGRMRVERVVAAPDVDADAELGRAALLESHSSHPIAAAIAAAATPPADARVEHVQEDGGRGITGRIDGVDHFVAGPNYLRENDIDLPDELRRAAVEAEARGSSCVYAGAAGAVRALVVVADQVRPDSADVIARLRRLGLRVVMLTGDHAAPAASVASRLGIDAADVVSEVLPTDKADTIAELQRAGAVVAMVGDGINDAPALAQADLGISMGTGADIAIQASDITLVGARLGLVPDAIRLARATLRTIYSNLFWAFAYNVLALPLAALGYLNPLIAAAAMAFSSLFVVLNSLRLHALRFHHTG